MCPILVRFKRGDRTLVSRYFAGTDVDDYPGLHGFLANRETPWKGATPVEQLIDDNELVAKLGTVVNAYS